MRFTQDGMPTLTELANLYGSDKGSDGPSPKWPGNNYAETYETYLGPLRHAPIALLEIGLGVRGDRWDARIVHGRNEAGGASIKLWSDYFTCAKIYGIDVNPALFLDNDRVRTFVGDQGSATDLIGIAKEIGSYLDIIIDDASHRPDHQQISLSVLFPFLKAGGLYFIEDLSANGLGDKRRGRHACELVLNTRNVLRGFKATGGFPHPHGLTDPTYLAQQIVQIEFFADEKLCLVRKR